MNRTTVLLASLIGAIALAGCEPAPFEHNVKQLPADPHGVRSHVWVTVQQRGAAAGGPSELILLVRNPLPVEVDFGFGWRAADQSAYRLDPLAGVLHLQPGQTQPLKARANLPRSGQADLVQLNYRIHGTWLDGSPFDTPGSERLQLVGAASP
ncbi:MAG: hypothetical protein BIFFINMI_00371 [Phycisphaerae bacterium]|nr:hypothetical protein [Phycisphaerae bacterium]